MSHLAKITLVGYYASGIYNESLHGDTKQNFDWPAMLLTEA